MTMMSDVDKCQLQYIAKMSGKHILTNITAKHILTERNTNTIEVFLLKMSQTKYENTRCVI